MDHIDLDEIRQRITIKFANNKRFLVKVKNSKGEECDNVYLSKKVHNVLKRDNCKSEYDELVFATVQRDQDKIRLRFYKKRLNDYKGVEKHIIQKFKLKSPYYNAGKSIEAFCFDYSIASKYEQDVDEFICMFNKLCSFATKKQTEKKE